MGPTALSLGQHALKNQGFSLMFRSPESNRVLARWKGPHLTGTVKGNSSVTNQTFDVTSGGGGTVTVNGCTDPMCPIPESCPQ
jgi:hypothetical protein